ncbi:LOW QUALITY PROTEIN: TRAF3-interacting protein 1-like [Amphiura filiformis]|uniref:LOW QUALITY PROTEIN: TRAF3-interacting protein 1-like n=1 Tax=Amphiura filiformis TaxID=82378 RepID=UPI003B227B4A
MGEDFVKETQSKLGKIIDKPPLTEKLLKKPPFRYLHDIITEVVKKSGFMKGLYNDSEMDSKNFKDKESKIAFLQKAVEVAVMVTGKSLSVRPSKIVAGHEPEKTNELLQVIANAILKKMDSTDAVRKVLNGEKPGSGKPPKPHKDEEKGKDRHSEDKHKRDKENREKKSSSNRERSSSRDKEKDRQKDRSKDRDKERNREKDKNRERSKDRDREKDKSRDKERSKDKERTRDKDKHRDKDHIEKDRSKDRNKEKENGHEPEQDKDKEKEKDRERRERRKRKDEEEAKRKEQEEQQQPNENHEGDEEDMRPPTQEDDGSSSNRIQRPSSAKGQRRRPTKDNEDTDSDDDAELDGHGDAMVNGDDGLPPQGASRRMARPSSARPAPPRVKKQESVDDPGSRVGSGKQVSNVIVDNGQNSDDDDTFVVQETQPLVEDEQQPIGSEAIEDDGEHGGLVKKILETKKELEGGNKIQNKEEKPVIMDAARRKQRELIQREVEKLRGSIQTLTRSANPLGKIMDYLQEDVDSMQKELEMWKKENQEHALAIKREEGITSTELEPLQAQLSELDQSIADQLDAIAAVKSNIIRNDEKVNKMLSSVAFSR